MAIKRNISYHISEDRLDRACYIATKVGIGEIVKERKALDEQGRLAYRCVTDTGVILVMNANKTKVVTLFVATVKQIAWIYEGKTPTWLYKIAKKNAVHVIAQEK